MHCVLLGVVKLLLKLWFTSTHHRELWYIGRKVKDLLYNIKPPDEIRQTPRKIETTVKYWKGIWSNDVQHHEKLKQL